jgi:hypothetical protein
MKHLSFFNNFIKEAYQIDELDVPFFDAYSLDIEQILDINNMYGEILPYINDILEEWNIYSSLTYFFNGYFSHNDKVKDHNFFNKIAKDNKFIDKELFMIKGIMVDGLDRETIIELAINQNLFDQVISVLKVEDSDNILSQSKLKIFEDILSYKEGNDKKIEMPFCTFYGYKPIRLKTIWRKGNNYSIRFTLDIKNI